MSTPLGSSQWMYSSGAEVTQQSLKFNDDESQYLSWTPAAAGNRKTWTWSGWVKRGTNTATSTGTFFSAYSSNSDSGLMYLGFLGDGHSYSNELTVNWWNGSTLFSGVKFRDPSSWYHVVIAVDTTQATSTNRVKAYINGVQLTTSSYVIPQNTDTAVNNTVSHGIGSALPYSGQYFDGYLSDVYFIDGQALDASSFGQFTNGYWKAKDYAGTYGTNGFHLTFQDDVVSEGFNTVTYRGNGGTQSVSGLGLAADLVWLKGRSYAEHHHLYDTIRGATEVLYSNRTVAEASDTLGLTSFDSDGFSIGSRHEINNSGDSFVAWCWDAGSGSAASNTDGSITSTVKANPDYGFSVVSWTGTGSSSTVGHGLSSTPELIINKNRSAAENWVVYSTAQPDGSQYLRLNGTSGLISDSSVFGGAANSTTFTVGTNPEGNGNGNNHIAYCFNSVAGYSSIGSYSGTGSGVTVNCGFRPAFIMIKATNLVEGWAIIDGTRDTINPRNKVLKPNSTNAEASGSQFNTDFTDTGFVMNGTDGVVNASGGTYIYMAFADTREAAFWKDVSGNNNNWTPNNLDYRDSLIDSPANNFAVMNSIDVPSTGTLSEGNLKVAGANYLRRKANWHFGAGGIQSGKWYWEICNVGSAYGTDNGVIGSLTEAGGENFLVANKSYFRTGGIYKNYTSTSYVSSGATYTSGDVVGFALDLDSSPQTIKYYHNGTLINTDSTISAAPVLVPFTSSTNGSWPDTYYNFGQDSTFAGATTAGGNTDDNGIGDFAYAPPSGYLALCTANLPEPSIVDGSEHFNTALWTGDNTSNRSITVGFEPDFVWLKNRNGTFDHRLWNSVIPTHRLVSNSTAAEVTTFGAFDTNANGINVWNTVNDNNSGVTYASWNWKASGTAVSNTDGSITSQVSANTDAGFSIATYTGTGANASFGHGLGVAPDMVIVKRRDSTAGWTVFHKDLTTTHILILDSTTGSFSSNQFSPDPSSSVVSVLNQPNTNASGGTYVAYSFANTDGFSKVGSYTGNGSEDGPFVYTGFRPAWVMIKRTDSTSNWHMVDSERDSYNMAVRQLQANLSNSEASVTYGWDILSNGFKLRTDGANYNASGGTYIYLAFAENPFKYANAR